MEEVDNIIIHSLRQIGCDIEEDVKGLKHFTTDLVIDATVRCLEVIQPGLGFPHSLPSNMSARFRLGASIAQFCQDIGYSGDIGYQTFLYFSEADIRKVFMFLIEKLPKESEKGIVEPTGSTGCLQKAINEKLKSQLSSSWVPSDCLSKGLRWCDDGTFSREGCGQSHPFLPSKLNVPPGENALEDITNAWKEFYANHLPTVTKNPSSQRQLLPTLISLNSKCALSESYLKANLASCDKTKLSQQISERIAQDLELCSTIKYDSLDSFHENNRVKNSVVKIEGDKQALKGPTKPKIAPRPKGLEVNSSIEKKRSQIDAIERAKQESEALRQRFEDLQVKVKKLSAKSSQVEKEIALEEQVLKDKEESLRVKRLTKALVPEAGEHISRFEQIVENNARQVVVIARHFEKHYQAPSLQKYRQAKQHNSNKANPPSTEACPEISMFATEVKSESQRQADAVRNLREKARELNEEVRIKEQLHLQLLAEYEKVTKDINRSAYTRRIMEIIGNIRKQKDEIDKVLKDTKELQKEINNLTGQLDRSFTVADELIFRDAKKDEASRRAYKLLATLHSDCSDLVQVVEETGATVREIRDLEEQIDLETLKNVGGNLERISADLKQMKQESTALTAQIKSKS